jgi:hypothetical protein
MSLATTAGLVRKHKARAIAKRTSGGLKSKYMRKGDWICDTHGSNMTYTMGATWLGTTGTSTGTTTVGNWQWTNGTSATSVPIYVNQQLDPVLRFVATTGALSQPADSTHLRRPPPREFNRYINASDLMEEFIRFLGTQHVRQGEVMGLPLDLFIKWLIIRACEEDQEEPNVELVLPPRPAQPHCLGCGRFVKRHAPARLCDSSCASRHFARVAAAA